jgi:hypothetical protein
VVLCLSSTGRDLTSRPPFFLGIGVPFERNVMQRAEIYYIT